MIAVFFLALVFGFRIDATTYEIDSYLVSDCKDGLDIAFIDSESWTIYGDQNLDGRINGSECDWR